MKKSKILVLVAALLVAVMALTACGGSVALKDYLNPDSLIVMKNAKIEESIEGASNGEKFQFVRNGYFCVDIHNPRVINRIVTLKDGFKK